MNKRKVLIQIMYRLLLMVVALASASFTRLAANQPPACETTRIGEFTDKNRHAFEPTSDGDWVLVRDDVAKIVFQPRTQISEWAAFSCVV